MRLRSKIDIKDGKKEGLEELRDDGIQEWRAEVEGTWVDSASQRIREGEGGKVA